MEDEAEGAGQEVGAEALGQRAEEARPGALLPPQLGQQLGLLRQPGSPRTPRAALLPGEGGDERRRGGRGGGRS